jgi:hypothetical protein
MYRIPLTGTQMKYFKHISNFESIFPLVGDGRQLSVFDYAIDRKNLDRQRTASHVDNRSIRCI